MERLHIDVNTLCRCAELLELPLLSKSHRPIRNLCKLRLSSLRA